MHANSKFCGLKSTWEPHLPEHPDYVAQANASPYGFLVFSTRIDFWSVTPDSVITDVLDFARRIPTTECVTNPPLAPVDGGCGGAAASVRRDAGEKSVLLEKFRFVAALIME